MSDFFNTDWAAMTLNDWAGLIITVGIFFLMIWAYVYAFHPKNKANLESQRYAIFDDDDMDSKSQNGNSKS
jgi:cytochrome c oxidase cbb3-type subunit 4